MKIGYVDLTLNPSGTAGADFYTTLWNSDMVVLRMHTGSLICCTRMKVDSPVYGVGRAILNGIGGRAFTNLYTIIARPASRNVLEIQTKGLPVR